jgi:hypothetical protein
MTIMVGMVGGHIFIPTTDDIAGHHRPQPFVQLRPAPSVGVPAAQGRGLAAVRQASAQRKSENSMHRRPNAEFQTTSVLDGLNAS